MNDMTSKKEISGLLFDMTHSLYTICGVYLRVLLVMLFISLCFILCCICYATIDEIAFRKSAINQNVFLKLEKGMKIKINKIVKI